MFFTLLLYDKVPFTYSFSTDYINYTSCLLNANSMGDLLRMTWRKTKWVTHDMPSNLSSIFDWKVTLKITIPPFKERGKVGGRRVWRFAQQLRNLYWNGFPHLRWNFFLGIDMNFTIRVFTWCLGHYVNICKKPRIENNIPIIKIVAKKNNRFNSYKAKNSLTKNIKRT